MKIKRILLVTILSMGLFGCSNAGYTLKEEQAALEKEYDIQLEYLQTIETEDGKKHQYQTVDDKKIVFEAYGKNSPGLVATLMAAAFQQKTGVIIDNYRERLMNKIGNQYIKDKGLEKCKINEDGDFEIKYSSYVELNQAWSLYMDFINDVKNNEMTQGKIKSVFAPIYSNPKINSNYTKNHYLSNLPIPTEEGFNEAETKSLMIDIYIDELVELGINDETVPTELLEKKEEGYTNQEEWKMNGEKIAFSRRSEGRVGMTFGHFYHLLNALGIEVTGDIYDYTFSLNNHNYRISYQFYDRGSYYYLKDNKGSSYYLEDNKKIYGRDNERLQETNSTIDYTVFFPDLTHERIEK